MKRPCLLKMLLPVIVFLFVSCEDDKSPASYDRNYIVGNYSGSCELQCGNVNILEDNFSAKFMKDAVNTSKLVVELGDAATDKLLGLGNIGNVSCSNIVKPHKDFATFSLSKIVNSFDADHVSIPEFIKKMVPSYDIVSAKITLSSLNNGRYNPNRAQVEFTYKGIIEIKGKNKGQTHQDPITYIFVLKKI